jgi:Ca2+-binding RTX toxin-like protein
MNNVTVLGAGGATVTLSFDSAANAALARSLAGAVTEGVLSGALVPASSKAGPPPAVPAGKRGEWVQHKNGATVLPDDYAAIISTAKKTTIFGTGEQNATVLATGGLTFHSGGGSGTVVAGGGDNRIVLPSKSGDWAVHTGRGDDTINALGGGDDTVHAGAGRNTIQLGGGSDLVISEGRDRITLGTGSATIIASAGGGGDCDDDDDDDDDGKGAGNTSQQVWGGSGSLFFVGGAGPATVLGGTGSATIYGGNGPNEFRGGSAGNNVIYAGAGRATVFGGGDGDVIFAEGDEKQVLHAGPGAVTLYGAMAGGDNTFHAGSGDTEIVGGWGDDRFVAGLGDSTITGGPGRDVYVFINGSSGGNDIVWNFDSNDEIVLQGYGKGAVKAALASQVQVGGGVQITLADSTTVTFMGLNMLTKSDFG